MSANSRRLDDVEVHDTGSTENVKDVTYLYGSTGASSPLQNEKLKYSTSNIQPDMDGSKLSVQNDPLLLPNNQLNSGRIVLSEKARSSFTNVSIKSSHHGGWLSHPKIRENWKVVLGAMVLTVFGLIMFLTGVGILASPARGLHCLVFFVVGFICFIPGFYHLAYIYCILKGKPGYSFYQLPVMK